MLSEKIMTAPAPSCVSNSADDANTTNISKNNFTQQKAVEPKHISVRANCAIQGIVATLALLLWQIIYTLPRMQHLISEPMQNAGTTPIHGLAILFTIALANLLHSITFFSTLKHFPGGATSAGVLKGLQAVLVFAASSFILCGRWGGIEMCWSQSKGISLFVVVSGILLYGTFTKKNAKDSMRGVSLRSKGEYTIVGDITGGDGKIICV